MARRKISVDLELETARYLAGAKQVLVTTKAVDAEMERLGDEVDEVGRDMAQLAANTDVAKHQVDDLGDEALGAAMDLRLLDARIEATKLNVRELGLEFARTGEAASGKEGLAGQRSLLRQLERTRKELTDLGSAPVWGVDLLANAHKAGARAGDAFSSGLSSSLSGARNPAMIGLVGGLVTAAAAAAPMIGAVIGGALVGAAGTGAIAVGIASASKDPRVRTAARNFGENLADDFFGGGKAFVQPTIDALNILDRAVDDIDLGGALAKAAPTVVTIASGLADLGENVMPGLNNMIDRLGPFAEAAADGFGDLGSSIGDFADNVSNSEGAVVGIETGFRLLSGTIVALGEGIEWLSDRWMEMVDFQADAAEASAAMARLLGQNELAAVFAQYERIFRGLLDAGTDLDPAVDALAGGIETWGESAATAAIKGGDLIDVWNALHGEALTADEAMLNAKEAVDAVAESFKENGNALTGNSKAALENRIKIGEAGEAAAVAAQRYFDLTGDADGAARIIEEQKNASIRAAVANGGNAAKVKALADELFRVPANVTSTVNVQNSQAIAEIAETRREMNRLHDRTVFVRVRTVYEQALWDYRSGERRQHGGPVKAGHPYIVGEGGKPEWFVPEQNGTIVPMAQEWHGGSVSAASQAMGGGIDYNALAAALTSAGGEMTVNVLLDGKMIEPRMVRVISESNRSLARTANMYSRGG